MARTMARRVAAALLAIGVARVLGAQPASDAFLTALQAELRAGDRAAVAARLRYPVTVSIGGVRVPFANASSLLERYDDIFTPELLDELAERVVVQQVDGAWKVTSITVPAPVAPAAPIAPVAPTAPGAPAAPIRVGIRGGTRPTQFAGSLRPGATDVYLLWVPKGRVLEVRLTRVQGREALLRVVHATTGAPLNPRIAGEARVVTGVAPESADYRIEVRRDGSADPAPLPYMVSLTLK